MPSRRLVAAVAAAGLGAAIWAASPGLTGHVEPWVAAIPYYALELLGSGFVVGLVTQCGVTGAFAAAFTGLLLGQLLFGLVLLPGRWPIVSGAALLAIWSGLGALAAAAGSGVAAWIAGWGDRDRAGDAAGAAGRFRDLVRERGRALRRRSYAELEALAGSRPTDRLRIGARDATVATIVEPRQGGVLRVVVQGALHGRFLDVFQRVSVDGFYKHRDGSVTPMAEEDFLTATSVRLIDPRRRDDARPAR